MVFLCCATGAYVKTYDLTSDSIQLHRSMSSLNSEVTCARYNHNGKIIASSSVDGGISLDVASSGELLSRFFYPAKTLPDRRVNSVHFSSGSRFLASGGSDGCVHVWDLKTQEVTQSYNISASAVTSVTFSGYKDDFIVAGSESGAISICDVQSAETIGFLSVDPKFSVSSVTSVLASPHPYARQVLGSTYADGSVRVWDLHTGHLTVEFPNQHDAAATCLAISPVSKVLLATGGLDRRVLFFDTQQRRELRSMDFDHPVTALSLCADGKTIAIGTTNGDVLVYDLRGAITPLYTVMAAEDSKSSNGSGGRAAVNSLQFASSHTDTSNAMVSPHGQPVIATERMNGSKSPSKETVRTVSAFVMSPKQTPTLLLENLRPVEGTAPLFFSPPAQSSRPSGFTISTQADRTELELLNHHQHNEISSVGSQDQLREMSIRHTDQPSLLSLLAESSPTHSRMSEPPTNSEVLPLTSPTASSSQSFEKDRQILQQETAELRSRFAQHQDNQYQQLQTFVQSVLTKYDALMDENVRLKREVATLRDAMSALQTREDSGLR